MLKDSFMAKASKKRVPEKIIETQPPLPVPVTNPRVLAMITLGLIAACFLIYAQTGSHEFINYDDPNYVIKNVHVNQGVSVANLKWAFTAFDFYYWQPLTWLSLQLDSQLFGPKPGALHLTNMLFHMLNAVLLLLALHQLTGAVWRSGFAAALFALHPLRVESVAWIAERKDVLSGMFWMLTLLAYERYARSKSMRAYALTTICFLFAVMSKPSVVTLPFVLLLLDWWPLKRFNSVGTFGKMLIEKLPMFAVIAASSVLTYIGQDRAGATISLTALPFYFRVWNAITAYVRYVQKFLLPIDLGVLYPYGKITSGEVAGCLLLLAIITAAMLYFGRKRGYLVTGWFWFLGAMVPMIGLAQTGLQSMADRFTYLPMIGLAIIVGWGLADLSEQFRVSVFVRAGAVGLLLGVLSFASFIQTTHWKDSFTLFEHTIAVTKDNDVMHLNLASLYEEQNRINEALPHYEAALKIEPNNVEAHRLAGTLYLRKRDAVGAMPHFQAMVKLRPDDPDAGKGLADCLYATGHREEAKQQLQKVLKRWPNDMEARSKLFMMQ